LVEGPSEAQDQDTLTKVANRFSELKEFRSVIEQRLEEEKKDFDERDEQLDAWIAEWSKFKELRAGHPFWLELARLRLFVLQNEKYTNETELEFRRAICESMYTYVASLYIFTDDIYQRLGHAMTKEEAQLFVRQETKSLARNLLDRLRRREEDTRRRWIRDNLGQGAPR
jgi:hypothetical protein